MEIPTTSAGDDEATVSGVARSTPRSQQCCLTTTSLAPPTNFLGNRCTGLHLCRIQVAAILSIIFTYAVEFYKPIAASIFVAITVNKNVRGYGFAEFITPWIITDGYLPPTMLNMCLIFLWCSAGILFHFKSKTLRKWMRNSRVREA